MRRLLFICLFLTACRPSEGAVQTNIAETEAARPTETAIPDTETPEPTATLTPTPTATPTSTATANLIDRVITLEELTSVSESLGISEWELSQEGPGMYHACRLFIGHSWSFNPNYAVNCIRRNNGGQLDEIMQQYIDEGWIKPNGEILESSLNYENDFAVYVWYDAHANFDIFYLDEDLIYWASVSLGIPGGCDLSCMYYENNQQAIDDFLAKVISINSGNSR